MIKSRVSVDIPRIENPVEVREKYSPAGSLDATPTLLLAPGSEPPSFNLCASCLVSSSLESCWVACEGTSSTGLFPTKVVEDIVAVRCVIFERFENEVKAVDLKREEWVDSMVKVECKKRRFICASDSFFSVTSRGCKRRSK